MVNVSFYVSCVLIVAILLGSLAYFDVKKLDAQNLERCISAGMQYNNGNCIIR